jgi:hypothetical protein
MNLFVWGMVHIIDGWNRWGGVLRLAGRFNSNRRSNKSLTMNRFPYSNPVSSRRLSTYPLQQISVNQIMQDPQRITSD